MTQISFGIHHLEKLDHDYIDSLLHEIHHGSNHKSLKAQDPIGIYAEVNSLMKPKSKTQHQFSNLYPFYFHFDELSAYLKEILQIRGQLKKTPVNSEDYFDLVSRQDGYIETY